MDNNHWIRQRINQVNSQAGLPAVVDWSLANKVLQTVAVQQTWDRNMRCLAAATVEEHLHYRDPFDHLLPSGVLFGFDPRIPFPIEEIDDLIEEHFSEYYCNTCDVGVHIECEKPTLVITIGYGEWVCLYRCCRACWRWFNNPDPEKQRRGWPFNVPGEENRHVAT